MEERLTSRSSSTLPAVAVAAATAVVDLVAGDLFDVAIAYPIAIVAAASTRDRKFVWGLTAAAIALSYLGAVLVARAEPWPLLADRTLLAASVIFIAYFVDVWIGSDAELSAQNVALEASNQEISAREEEIARQNEELQSQSEELERQSEELRIANDELALRERTLAQLLALSRSLASELTRDEVMQTVCEWLADLLGDTADASALLLRQGDELRSQCHFGFGPEGPSKKALPYEASFASLVISRGQAGFLQDATLRPELAILEPSSGPPFRAVLGAPLVARGRPLGTIEAYSHAVTTWSEDQMNLVTSIAAQASLSLETARLFEELTHEKQRFETVLRTLPLSVFSCDDPECRQVTGNPAAAAFFAAPLNANFSPFTPLGSRINGAFYRQGRQLEARELPLVRAVLSGEEVLAEELDLVFPTGRRGYVLVSAAPFYDSEGRVSGGACAIVDITVQKDLQRDLDARRRESEEASVRKTRFLAAVSHDIRTPTNAIRLQADLIKRCASDPNLADRVPDLAYRLDRNATALVELISEVLDLTRFDSGKLELQETDFSIGETIAEECQHLAPLAAAKSLTLTCDSVEPPVWIHADRVKISRVLGNLIENAIKFTATGGVHVKAALRADIVELRVSDTGAGIAPEDRARIFDEFLQLQNPERDSAKGRGLGLAICKRLVDAIGGEIRLESTPGRGTTFIITLPAERAIARPSTAGRVASGATRLPTPSPLPTLDNLRVLIVEDHADTRQAIAELLREERIEVLEAGDVRTALELLDEAPPDVVLLDLMLPDSDGFEVLKVLHARRPARLRALIVLTGDLASRSREEMDLLGTDAILQKPVDPRTLVDFIRSLVTRGPV